MKDNVVYDKSKAFAVRVVKLYKFLCEDKREFVLSKQLLRCGTSIGANVAEGIHAMSKKEFVSKLNISLKETFETLYWLELLNETEYITNKQFSSMQEDCAELAKLLTSIIKTSKGNL